MGASEQTKFLTTVFVVIAWYTCNIGVLLLNKYLLSKTPFKAPVFLTLCHMTACATLGYILSASNLTPIKQVKSKKQLWKVALLSTIFCVTIVLGNLSLKYIPVSFNQAIGSTTPFFTAVFAMMLQGVREAGVTYLTLIPIAGGVVIASGGEPLFNLLGFSACLLATACRALKSVVQAMLLTDPSEKMDPMSLLFYMSSVSVLLLLPTTLILEPGSFAQVHHLCATQPGFFWSLLINSCIAYLVNLTNFLVTKYTSALTLQVLGNMKGVIAAGISIALFKNPVTAKGMMGYMITVAGVVAYSETKRRTKLQAVHQGPGRNDSMDESDSMPLLKASDGPNKDHLLPVLHGHTHRKGANSDVIKTIVIKATTDHSH